MVNARQKEKGGVSNFRPMQMVIGYHDPAAAYDWQMHMRSIQKSEENQPEREKRALAICKRRQDCVAVYQRRERPVGVKVVDADDLFSILLPAGESGIPWRFADLISAGVVYWLSVSSMVL